jgi:alpha-tubulin suppressor-like RCC1 family protein
MAVARHDCSLLLTVVERELFGSTNSKDDDEKKKKQKIMNINVTRALRKLAAARGPGASASGRAPVQAGDLYAWGEKSVRLLGNSESSGNGAKPVAVSTFQGNVTTMAAHDRRVLAITDDGVVYGWGETAVLGVSQSNAALTAPLPVPALSSHFIAQVAVGVKHCLALSNGGCVFAWGSGTASIGAVPVLQPSVVSELADVTCCAIGAGSRHSMAATTDGELFAWGDNARGQLGVGTAGHSKPLPTRITSMSGIVLAQLDGGSTHSLALTSDGEIVRFRVPCCLSSSLP